MSQHVGWSSLHDDVSDFIVPRRDMLPVVILCLLLDLSYSKSNICVESIALLCYHVLDNLRVQEVMKVSKLHIRILLDPFLHYCG